MLRKQSALTHVSSVAACSCALSCVHGKTRVGPPAQPARGMPRAHAAHAPATGPTPPSTVFRDLSERRTALVGVDLGRHGRSTPCVDEFIRYLTDVSTKVDTYQQPREPVEGGAVSECGVSAAWARGMPRAGWAGRRTPVLPCAQECAREQAAAKPTGTYLRRPRTPTPPRQPTECQLLLLLLRLPASGRHYQGCRAQPCRKTHIKKQQAEACCFGVMVRPERFELPTAWFVARYSIQLSYGRQLHKLVVLTVYGAPGEIRTPDRLVRSQVLYPTELRARGTQSTYC